MPEIPTDSHPLIHPTLHYLLLFLPFFAPPPLHPAIFLCVWFWNRLSSLSSLFKWEVAPPPPSHLSTFCWHTQRTRINLWLLSCQWFDTSVYGNHGGYSAMQLVSHHCVFMNIIIRVFYCKLVKKKKWNVCSADVWEKSSSLIRCRDLFPLSSFEKSPLPTATIQNSVCMKRF